MFEFIPVFLVIFLVIFVIVMTWYDYCNNKTFKQRMILIEDCIKNPHFMEAYDSVSYEQHFHALLKFQNPHMLYNFGFTKRF